MPGHVFLVHGHLDKLACDAWLVPSSSMPKPGHHWQHAVAENGPPDTPTSWSQVKGRVIPWEPLQPDWPRPWLVRTSFAPNADAKRFVEPAREFLNTASAALGASPRHGRASPILALPVVGAGAAGGARKAGQIVRELLPALYEFVGTHSVDIALVMKDPAQYAAAQAVRSEQKGDLAWPELDDQLRRKVDELASRAYRDDLVLFLGAGISQAAGLPSWGGLLNKLAGEELASDAEFQKLSALDQARVLQKNLLDDDGLGKAVANHLGAQHYSLVHGLLASLPVCEVVTTNYDTLFEMASAAAKRNVDVLPYHPAGTNARWMPCRRWSCKPTCWIVVRPPVA
jgi:hypothetical protein